MGLRVCRAAAPTAGIPASHLLASGSGCSCPGRGSDAAGDVGISFVAFAVPLATGSSGERVLPQPPRPRAAGEGLPCRSAACTAPGRPAAAFPAPGLALPWAPAAWLYPCRRELPAPWVSALWPCHGVWGQGGCRQEPAGTTRGLPERAGAGGLRRVEGLQQPRSKTLLLFLSLLPSPFCPRLPPFPSCFLSLLQLRILC